MTLETKGTRARPIQVIGGLKRSDPAAAARRPVQRCVVDLEPDGETGFAERLLEVIDAGRRTATYKLALLLALIDLCARQTDHEGRGPEVLYTRDIAQQVAALYWPQVAPFGLAGSEAVG